MTCIAAIKGANGSIHMAGDRQASYSNNALAMAEPKVMARNGFVYGVTGSHRTANILRHGFSEPPKLAGQEFMNYMVNSWIPAWVECLQKHGQKEVIHNISNQEAWLMIGHEGRLFIMASDFSMVEEVYPYAAIGCGGNLAKGALAVIESFQEDMPPSARLMAAIGTAILHDSFCGGQIDIVELEFQKEGDRP
jgi:ATP-dependent protease HslVU (ClpYQ) peptidase subunit